MIGKKILVVEYFIQLNHIGKKNSVEKNFYRKVFFLEEKIMNFIGNLINKFVHMRMKII